jgi:hypothetical protein
MKDVDLSGADLSDVDLSTTLMPRGWKAASPAEK